MQSTAQLQTKATDYITNSRFINLELNRFTTYYHLQTIKLFCFQLYLRCFELFVFRIIVLQIKMIKNNINSVFPYSLTTDKLGKSSCSKTIAYIPFDSFEISTEQFSPAILPT